MVMDSKNLSNKNIVQIDGGGEGFLGRDNAFTGGNDAKMVQNGASDFGLSGGSAYNWKINGGVGDNVRDDGWNGREVFGGGSEEVARGTDWVGQKNEKTPQFFGTLNDTKTVQAWNNGVVKNTKTPKGPTFVGDVSVVNSTRTTSPNTPTSLKIMSSIFSSIPLKSFQGKRGELSGLK